MKCSILRIPLLLLAWNLLTIMPLPALTSDGLSVPSGQDPVQEGLKPIEEFLGNKTVGVMTGKGMIIKRFHASKRSGIRRIEHFMHCKYNKKIIINFTE